MKTTTRTIRQKKGKEPIVCCTAYDAPMAHYADEAGVDLILVGDSMGNVILGYQNTVPVTLEAVIHHCGAVHRANPSALIVGDIPFGVADHSIDFVIDACVRLMREGGAEAVKIEGGEPMASKIAALTRAGIPVMGHIGFQPQQVQQLGGHKKFGKVTEERERLLADAKALEAAGVFAIVGEMLDADTAAALQAAMATPLIGIGAGKNCDGQILVSHDLLGMTAGFVPSFVKQYAKIGETMKAAFAQYAQEVRERTFPE